MAGSSGAMTKMVMAEPARGNLAPEAAFGDLAEEEVAKHADAL